ncbi:MAG: hypothetical protein ABIL62_01775, partial [Planctomycetota bacterium]
MLEEQFCRCGPEAFFRMVKGIRGRKHHTKVNPFYRGSAGGRRIVMETDHPTYGCKLYCEIEEQSEDAVPARQVIIQDQNTKYRSILITEKMQDPKDLSKELNRLGITRCNLVELWCLSQQEDEWIKGLCKGVGMETGRMSMTSYENVQGKKFV